MIALVGDEDMAPDFGAGRHVETASGDGDLVVVDRTRTGTFRRNSGLCGYYPIVKRGCLPLPW